MKKEAAEALDAMKSIFGRWDSADGNVTCRAIRPLSDLEVLTYAGKAAKMNPGKKKLHKKRSLDTLALVARKGAGSGYHKSRPAREKRLPRKMKHKKPAETES